MQAWQVMARSWLNSAYTRKPLKVSVQRNDLMWIKGAAIETEKTDSGRVLEMGSVRLAVGGEGSRMTPEVWPEYLRDGCATSSDGETREGMGLGPLGIKSLG